MRRASRILLVLALALAGVVLVQAVIGARTGPLPLAGVFEVHLLLLATVCAVLALPGTLGAGRGRAWARIAIVAVVLLAIVRLGDELWSPGPDATAAAVTTRADPGTRLRLLSWNLELGARSAAATVDGIREAGADVVALQELTPDAARAIEADADVRAAYPYRILEPDAGVAGMGLLANRPLLVRGSTAAPRVLRAGLLLDDGRIVELLDVHPYPPRIGTAGPLPLALDTRTRDAELADIGEIVAGLDDPGAAVVVGDLNAAPTEAGLAGLLEAAGGALSDAHAEVGSGPGFTWRPSGLAGLGIGLLRIDHVLTGDWVRPLTAATDCAPAGDHCRLLVTLEVRPGAAP